METINDSRKCTSTKTLDKNKKTLILVLRCRHYKRSLRKSFEVMNEVFTFNRFRVYISICIVALSSNCVLLVLILIFLCFIQALVAQISFYKLHWNLQGFIKCTCDSFYSKPIGLQQWRTSKPIHLPKHSDFKTEH